MYAHTAERVWECNSNVKHDCDDDEVDDIAEQLVSGPVGKHLKVIFGGGRYNFLNETEQDEEGNVMFMRVLNLHLFHHYVSFHKLISSLCSGFTYYLFRQCWQKNRWKEFDNRMAKQ